MIRVGLTGGFATGKTFVAAEFARLGCHIISADRLGHEVLRPDGEAYAPVVARFGKEIVNERGEIQRRRLGDLVFSSPALLAELNAIVHPAVFRLEEEQLRACEARDPQGIAMVEAAILIETGRWKVFDRLVLTACDEATQIARGMERDGLTADQVMARLAQQMSLREKLPHAHFVIETGGEPADTLRQVAAVYGALKAL